MARWDRCVHNLCAPTFTQTRAHSYTQSEQATVLEEKTCMCKKHVHRIECPGISRNENDQIFSLTDCKIECLLWRSQCYCGMPSKDTGTNTSLPAEGADWNRKPAMAGDAWLQTLCKVMFCLPGACHVPV